LLAGPVQVRQAGLQLKVEQTMSAVPVQLVVSTVPGRQEEEQAKQVVPLSQKEVLHAVQIVTEPEQAEQPAAQAGQYPVVNHTVLEHVAVRLPVNPPLHTGTHVAPLAEGTLQFPAVELTIPGNVVQG